MSWVVFVAPGHTSQADTIIVGPFRSIDRAEDAMARIERIHGERVACMVMDCLPAADIPWMFS